MTSNWAKLKFLNNQDHEDLQLIEKYYNEKDFSSAWAIAKLVDTIVREEIPTHIYYHLAAANNAELAYWPEPYKSLYSK
jgi:hypothetical protein